MTEIFYAIGESVNPMIELLPIVGNVPNVLVICAGFVIFGACINMLIQAKREGTE